MSFPDDPIGDQWTDEEDLNAETLHQRIDVPLDALRASVAQGWLGSDVETTDVPLGAIGNANATASSVTIALEYTRRIRIDVSARFQCEAGAPGAYSVQCAYSSGSTPHPGTATTLTLKAYASCANTFAVGTSSVSAFATTVLDPGTYTFFGVVIREAGGDPTDVNSASHVLLTDCAGGD